MIPKFMTILTILSVLIWFSLFASVFPHFSKKHLNYNQNDSLVIKKEHSNRIEIRQAGNGNSVVINQSGNNSTKSEANVWVSGSGNEVSLASDAKKVKHRIFLKGYENKINAHPLFNSKVFSFKITLSCMILGKEKNRNLRFVLRDVSNSVVINQYDNCNSIINVDGE